MYIFSFHNFLSDLHLFAYANRLLGHSSSSSFLSPFSFSLFLSISIFFVIFSSFLSLSYFFFYLSFLSPSLNLFLLFIRPIPYPFSPSTAFIPFYYSFLVFTSFYTFVPLCGRLYSINSLFYSSDLRSSLYFHP